MWISKEEGRGKREGQGKERIRKNSRKIRKEAKEKEGKGVRKKGGKKERWKKREKSRSIYSHCVSDHFPFLSDFYIADLKALE